MSESALKAAYEKALTLPDAEQEEAAELLLEYVAMHAEGSLLTVAQRAEVERRLADPDTRWIDQDEVFAGIDKLLATR